MKYLGNDNCVTLSFEEESALHALLDIVFGAEVFVKDEDDDEWYHTTGEILNLESIHSSDIEVLRKMYMKTTE